MSSGSPRRDASPASRPAARVRAVLFDLDGTLIDSIPLILASFRYATETVLGQAISDEVLLHNVGVPLVRQMHELSPGHAEELLRAYREHNAIHHDASVRGFPGTEQALERVQALGYPLGVVTSKAGEGARRGLAVSGLEHFFPVVVSCDDSERHKPDPEPLEIAARLLGVSLEHCAYVGDSEYDMAAAVAGGAVGIAALWGPFEAERILGPGPDYAIASLADLPKLLETERGGCAALE